MKLDDAGVYVCSLMFDNGKSLSASLMLTVSKRVGHAPGRHNIPFSLNIILQIHACIKHSVQV